MEWSIIREPDDRLTETRISLGSMPGQVGIYFVFRGDPDIVVDVLEKTLEKAKDALPKGEYDDKRGRPQG